MAEIKDVYSLEFNSDDFNNQLNSAIQEVEALQAALENGAEGTEDLEKATSKLISVLKTETQGIDNLNAKRDALLKTQREVNKETRTGALVSGELTKTNKALANETANVAGKQRGYFSQLVTGARNLNGLRRAASLVGNAFRVVAGINPVGLALTAIPIVIGLFTSLFKKAEETKTALDRLNDPETGLQERKILLKQELDNLDNLEKSNKKLTDEQKQQREELREKYRQTAEEIKKIEEDRINSIRDLETQAERARIKLLGNTTASVKANAELETELLRIETGKRSDNFIKESNRIAKELDDLAKQPASDNTREAANALRRELRLLEQEIEASNKLSDVRRQAIQQDANAAIQRLAESRVLKDSLQALEAELSRLQTVRDRQTSTLDAAALARIQARIDAQRRLVEDAKKRIADLEGVQRAQESIERLRTELIEDETERRVKQLEQAAERERQAVVGNEKQKAEQILLINQKLTQDIDKENQKRAENEAKAQEQSKQDTIKRIEEALSREKAFEDAKLSIALQGIEQRRNAELNDVQSIENVEDRRKRVEEINKRFDAERLAEEKKRQQVSLEAEIAATENIIEVRRQLGLSTEAEAAAIEKLRLELIQLARTDVKVELNKEETEEDIKALIVAITDGVGQVSAAIFDAISAGYGRLIEQLDKAVDRSKSALDEIRSNSENFNARQLELEKERLEKLQEERRKAVQREQAIGIIQLTTNSLIAISKAAAEGGIAAPFTIASTIIALLAGFASARAAAQNAFFEGEEYVDKENRYPHGRDTVPARLHKGERVVTADKNRKYWDTLSAVHKGAIPADVLNGFVRQYKEGNYSGVGNVLEKDGKQFVFVQNATNNSGLESRLERIEEALLALPQFMPRVAVNANARGIFKVVERFERRADAARKVRDR
jgi:hypothetical protein